MALQGSDISPILSFNNNLIQEKFVFSPERRVAYAGAIRSGKTVGACARKLFLAQLMPGSRFLIGRKDFNDLYNTTLKELFALIAASNGGDWRTPGPLVRRYDGQFHDLYLRTKGEDSVLHFRHLKEVSKQLGVENSGYFIDQIEEVEEEVLDHIRSRTTWWNAKRSAEFKARYGFMPKSFETLACNPDPGWIRSFLFDQEDENSRFYRDEQDRFKLFEADVEQNRKNLPEGWIEEQERTHTKSWVSRFLRGSWDIKGGAVYEDFDEDVHGIEEFKIPAHWPRFISLDWGTNHPCAVYWGAVDERSNLYVYDEYFFAGKIVSQVAEEIHAKSKKHSSAPWADDFGGLIVWMDPSTNQHHGVDERTIMDEFRNHQIYGLNANNHVNAGINKICERLKHDSTAKPPIKPTVFIFKKKCPALIQGMKVYVWQPPNSQGISVERPVKKDDDAVDSFRYLVMAVLETTSPGKKPRSKIKNEMDKYIMDHFMLGDGK
jgi:hypothetical protein